MDWTLGITNGFSFCTAFITILMFALIVMFFINILLSFFLATPVTRTKITLHWCSSFFVSLFISYSAFAHFATLEISESDYKLLQEQIEPYMSDQKIKELLSGAKKDGEISTAERDRLYHRIKQIKDLQTKEQVVKEGAIAKKLLIEK